MWDFFSCSKRFGQLYSSYLEKSCCDARFDACCMHVKGGHKKTTVKPAYLPPNPDNNYGQEQQNFDNSYVTTKRPSYPSQSYPSPSYPSQSYPSQSYPSPSYPSQSYPSPSYPSQSYPSPSYPSQSYPSPSTPKPDSDRKELSN